MYILTLFDLSPVRTSFVQREDRGVLCTPYAFTVYSVHRSNRT